MDARPLYGDLASLYDPIYTWKDYAAEAERVHALLAAEGIEDGARVVEGACGTGSYLGPLARWYDVAGFDRSEAMLAIARRKHPEATVWRADLETFTLDRPADAFLCLFSSIGYVAPEDIAAVARATFQALRPGGVSVLEPFVHPDAYRAGAPHMQTYEDDDLKLVRAVISHRDGDRAVMRFHWLVARRDADAVEHHEDEHVLWLHHPDDLVEVHRAAGFDARLEPDGLMKDRPLLVARRP